MKKSQENFFNIDRLKSSFCSDSDQVFQIKKDIFLILTQLRKDCEIASLDSSLIIIFPIKDDEDNLYGNCCKNKFMFYDNRLNKLKISINSRAFILYLGNSIKKDMQIDRLIAKFSNKKRSFFTAESDSITKVCINNISMEIFKGNKRSIFLKKWVLKLLNSSILNISHGLEQSKTIVVGIEDQKKLYKAKNILIENMASPPDLKKLASMCSINEHKLKNGFKNLFGDPPKSFLRKLRMEKAKEMIMERGLSVTETALCVGYSNPSAFSAVFSKFHGSPPSYFKNL